jgi:GH43 family beta-xylosidase
MKNPLLLRVKYLIALLLLAVPHVFGAMFQNPIITAGADPTCIYWNSNYYYMHTDGGLYVRKAPHIVGSNGIGNASGVSVFTPVAPNNQNIWAPELRYINGEWYIYFAAGTTNDPTFLNQRMYCIKANSQDPQGSYTMMGKVYDANADYYAIDGNVLQTSNGSLYFVWSGRASGSLGDQNLYIAPMSNPWTLSGPRVLLSKPTYFWEGGINEAPTFVTHNGVINLVYSANGGSTDNYCLGLLANSDGNVLNPGSWVKNSTSILKTYLGSDGAVYAPGSCTFTKSVDGAQDWIIFHTAQYHNAGWNREVHAQSFTWTPGFNTPSLGHPFPNAEPLAVPSGEAMVPATTSREAHLRLQDRTDEHQNYSPLHANFN